MKERKLETLLGSVVLLCACLFLGFILKALWQPKGNSYAIKAYFDNTSGLELGADVTISGVRVGTVTAIDLLPSSYMVCVSMVLPERIVLPLDSNARIETPSILGNKTLTLVPGTSSQHLPADGTIQKTQGSVSLESLLGDLLFSKQS